VTRAIVGALLAVPLAAVAQTEPNRHEDDVHGRWVVIPGVQFGARSQELSLGIAGAETTQGFRREGGPYLVSAAYGARLELVSSGWSPQAVHAVGFVSVGFFAAMLPLPVVFEATGGYGGGNGQGYGIAGVGAALGIAGRFEAFARAQAAIGESSTPTWFSNWLFGLRYGFPIDGGWHHKVTTETVPE
jgi:hypothetical protein